MKDKINKWEERLIRKMRLKLLNDKKLRKEILSRDAYTCQLCREVDYSFIYYSNSKVNKKIMQENPLEIHHIKSLGDPNNEDEIEELAYDKNNMITLCKNCHKKVTGSAKKYELDFQKAIEENS